MGINIQYLESAVRCINTWTSRGAALITGIVHIYSDAGFCHVFCFLCFISLLSILVQSSVCLWMHTDAGVEVMTLNGAVCLFHLVSANLSSLFVLFLIIAEFMSLLLFQPIESLTCLWPTSTRWTLLKSRDMLLWGKSLFGLISPSLVIFSLNFFIMLYICTG